MGREPTRPWFFFSPSGRLSRGPYALGMLFWFALQAASIAQLVEGNRLDSDALLILGLLALIASSLVGAVSMAMLTIKRVHDIGHPGLIAFLIFVPAVSFFALIFFLVFPSGRPNNYGYYSNQPE